MTRMTKRLALGLGTMVAVVGVGAVPAEANPNAPLLGLGSTGHGVWCVQGGLNFVAGAGLTQDSIYGQATYNAVLNFQRYFNMRYQDGVVGPETGSFLGYLVDLRVPHLWEEDHCWDDVPS